MKAAFFQITGRTLILTPVKKAGKQNIFGTPQIFELPENLSGGKAFSNIHGLSIFTANCIRGTELADRPFIFCLDDNHIVTKEYKHLPAREADLKKLSRLEAETVLQDGAADDYAIATQEYHHIEPATGRLKSVLFAVPKSLVAGIRQEFRQAGIKIIKIMPLLNGMMSSCKSVLGLVPKSPLYINKTIAVIDAGCENLRLILFSNGEVIFQKEFDSVWEDILEILHREGSISYEDAEREMIRPGFLLTGGSASFGDSLTTTVNALLETAAAEVIRNVRVVLSSERLEADKIMFCGAVASHPDFNKFIENLSLDVPFENIETACSRFPTLVGLEQQAAVAGCHAGDFFSLNGLLAERSADSIDFIAEENVRRGNLRLSMAIMAVLTLLAIGIMSIEPILHQIAVNQQKADQSALSSPQVTEIKNMQAQQNKLQTEVSKLESDKNLLPYQKSKMEEIVSKLQVQLIPNIDSLTSCQISGTTGVVTVNFTTKTFDQFNRARKSIADAGYFSVLAPFSAAKSNSAQNKTPDSYQCTATLQVKNFKPAAVLQPSSEAAASPSGKGGSSK